MTIDETTFDHDPDAPHISELDPDTEVVTQTEDGGWIHSTVKEVLDAEESGEDMI